MWSAFLIAFEFFLIGIPLHVLLCRLTSSYKFMAKSLFLGFFMLLFLAGFQHQTSSVDFLALYVFSTCWIFYLINIFRLAKSPLLKVLNILAKNPQVGLHPDELGRFFHHDQELSNRIVSMKTNGFLIVRSERLCLTTKAQKTLAFVRWLRKTFCIQCLS